MVLRRRKPNRVCKVNADNAAEVKSFGCQYLRIEVVKVSGLGVFGCEFGLLVISI